MIGMRARSRRGIFMKRTCKQCGKEFELSESEISFYKSKGLELPKRCQACRNQNKVQSDKVQKTAKEKSSMSDSPQHNRENGNCGNDKGHIVKSVVAVILLIAVFGIKNFLSISDESISSSTDFAAVEMPRTEEQELTDELLLDVASETFVNEQQSSTSGWLESEHEQQIWDDATVQLSEEQAGQGVSDDTDIIVGSEIALETLQETSDVIYSFRKAQYLTEHFEKHGAEFPYETEEEYLSGANNVIQNPEALHKLEAEDGDDVYFVESTNEFVVVSTDGFIRTYFKANIDYYNRQ